MRNKLMMTLALAAALGLTACGGNTATVPATNPEPVEYVDEITDEVNDISEEEFTIEIEEIDEDVEAGSSEEPDLSVGDVATDDITPILGYWYADGQDYFMVVDEDGCYFMYEQVSNVSNDTVEFGTVSTTVMEDTYGFVADGAEETVLYSLSEDGNELMGYSSIFTRNYTGSYVDPAVGVDPADIEE